jgi:hypothetical protein
VAGKYRASVTFIESPPFGLAISNRGGDNSPLSPIYGGCTMTPRFATFLILTAIVGCHSPLTTPNVDEPRTNAPEVAVKAPRAAAELPVTAAIPAPETPADHLAEAGRSLERDDLNNAGIELAIYLNAKPDALAVRVQYAEILASLNRRAEARGQFNQFLACAQEQKADASATMIHVYRRLMEIAEEGNDEYGVHLYRGIGLYLLSQRRAQLGASEQELPVEGLLCKAAAELTLAHDERPQEAQVSWYLFQVWSQLGQRHPALVRLREAHDSAPFSYLSPAESRKLSMACLDSLNERNTH